MKQSNQIKSYDIKVTSKTQKDFKQLLENSKKSLQEVLSKFIVELVNDENEEFNKNFFDKLLDGYTSSDYIKERTNKNPIKRLIVRISKDMDKQYKFLLVKNDVTSQQVLYGFVKELLKEENIELREKYLKK